VSGGGLLGEMFKNFQALGISTKPQLMNNEIVLEITEEDFKNMALKNVDERAKQAISIKLLDGKAVIKIRIF